MVDALDGARGVVREEQVAPIGVQAELLARRTPVHRPEAFRVDPARQDGDRPAVRGARDLRGEAAGGRADEIHPTQDPRRDLARARVVEVVAVQRDQSLVGGDGERRPCREAEVGMDDVEALAPEAPLERARGLHVGLGAAGGEGVQLDVEVADAPQGLDLIADEATERRPLRGGVHVRDDERAHGEVADIHRCVAAVAGSLPAGRAAGLRELVTDPRACWCTCV